MQILNGKTKEKMKNKKNGRKDFRLPACAADEKKVHLAATNTYHEKCTIDVLRLIFTPRRGMMSLWCSGSSAGGCTEANKMFGSDTKNRYALIYFEVIYRGKDRLLTLLSFSPSPAHTSSVPFVSCAFFSFHSLHCV